VTTPDFDGPFDRLLHLVNQEQVDIWSVSLAAIVDAYVASLEEMRALDLEVATEFLLIAAVLLELKARRLLPDEGEGELDEELALWEERDLLLARLLECKTFKDAGEALARMADAAALLRPRPGGLEEPFVDLTPDLLAGVTPERLRSAYVTATSGGRQPRVDMDHVAPIRASVRDAVDSLVAELQGAGRISFRSLTGHLRQRLDVIVKFLAVLELYKQGLVELEQVTTFGELHIWWIGPETGGQIAAGQPTAAGHSIDTEEYDG
jgi:segregation and condensation protein A